MTISRGPVKTTGIKVGIYGTEGVGKTTFASQFPGAVFIDTEGSTRHMDVARFDAPESLKDVLEQLDYVVGPPDEIGTVVIDTVDWLEKFIFRAVCEEKSLKNIEDMGYGKGYVFAKQKLQGLLELLDLITAVEDEYGIKFEDEDLENMKTVGDVMEYIRAQGIDIE